MKPYQQQMIDDGLPAAFIMTAAERHAIWDKTPPRSSPCLIDSRLEQDRGLRAKQKEEYAKKRTQARLKSKGLIAASEQTINLSSTQENDMPKYVIKPLDKMGHPIMRAVTSINDNAADELINEKVLAAVKRGGSKVVNVLLVNTLRQVILAWEIKEGEVAPCDVAPFQPTEAASEETTAPEAAAGEAAQPAPEGQTAEEADVAKRKVKAKKTPKAAKAKKAPGNGGLRAGSKLDRVANLLKRKSGCTAAECLKAVGWNAISMPYMAKAAGLKLKKEKIAGKSTRYYATCLSGCHTQSLRPTKC